jgi:hypothetical protein
MQKYAKMKAEFRIGGNLGGKVTRSKSISENVGWPETRSSRPFRDFSVSARLRWPLLINGLKLDMTVPRGNNGIRTGSTNRKSCCQYERIGRQGNHCGRPAKEFDVVKAAQLRQSGLSWRELAGATGIPMHLLRNRLASAPGSRG